MSNLSNKGDGIWCQFYGEIDVTLQIRHSEQAEGSFLDVHQLFKLCLTSASDTTDRKSQKIVFPLQINPYHQTEMFMAKDSSAPVFGFESDLSLYMKGNYLHEGLGNTCCFCELLYQYLLTSSIIVILEIQICCFLWNKYNLKQFRKSAADMRGKDGQTF